MRGVGLQARKLVRDHWAYTVDLGLIFKKKKLLYHVTSCFFFKFRFIFLENWSQIYITIFF